MRPAIDVSGMTFGAEHELADIDRTRPLPKGFGWDEKDNTIVNSTGIANDPRGRLYGLGGEINTPPSYRVGGQVGHLRTIKKLFPEAKVNYRSNLHLHVRVPGLREDLLALKRWAMYNAYWLPRILPVIEPIPLPATTDPRGDKWFAGAMRRYRRRKRSHHTVLTPHRTERQLTARSVEEFLRFEVPFSKDGVPLWHAQARAAVNLRQLRETDTIEFRHFPGTLDEDELANSLNWVENYTLCALDRTWSMRPESLNPLEAFASFYGPRKFPAFPDYQHDLEIRYRATCHDGTISKSQIVRNINDIELGCFDDAAWEASLKW